MGSFMSIETIMIIAFIAGLGLALWKVYAFFPSKPLEDDDTTPETLRKLTSIMIEVHQPNMSHEALFEAMRQHPKFDEKKFWRFNHNKLHQLVLHHQFKDPLFRKNHYHAKG